MKRLLASACAAGLLAGCAQSHGVLPQSVSQPSLQDQQLPSVLSFGRQIPSPIKHVIIIFQENRSPDNLFQHLPGADIAGSYRDPHGQVIPLHAVPLTWPGDLAHSHAGFVTEYDRGKMDGWPSEPNGCKPKHKPTCTLGYVPATENAPYMAMAEQYVFGDRMFQTNQGPSYPAHQYIISGDSEALPASHDPVAENPNGNGFHGWGGGCDAPTQERALLISANGYENTSVYPCFERSVLSDLVDAKHLTWRYYQDGFGQGLWKAFDSIRHVRYSNQYANVVSPPDQILRDIAANNLASVSWLTPRGLASDHSGSRQDQGPAWVSAVVNAVGQSPYWNSTAILISWDDWGGWFDHVKPPVRNVYELGFRVPLIVVSPYAKAGYVSHVQYEFGSLLKFAESTFGLGSMHTTDEIANDLSDCFDFGQKPRKFVKIPAPPYRPNFSKVSQPPFPDDE